MALELMDGLATWSADVLGVGATWFDSTTVVLELAAVLWFEFISVDAAVVVAGAVAGATVVALVSELTGGVALLAFWSGVDVAGAAVEAAELLLLEL
jgi:hypothetical protein